MNNLNVSYYFRLLDRFSGPARKLSKVSAAARRTVHGMGGAATSADGAAVRLGSSSSAAARGLSAMGNAAAIAQSKMSPRNTKLGLRRCLTTKCSVMSGIITPFSRFIAVMCQCQNALKLLM